MAKTKSEKIIEKYNRYVAKTYNNLPVVLDRGDGIFLWDKEGNKFMDFWSSYSAVNFGHRHPRITEVAVKELLKGPMRTRACYDEDLALLGEKLSKLAKMETKIIPKCSGAEAVETALKTMRMYAYRVKGIWENKAEIVIAAGNFHGRTITVVSFSSEEQYRKDFGPHTPGFIMVPFNDITALKKAVMRPNVVGVLLEPIQGEGGIVVPAESYLNQVRIICDDLHILLALDEIQTGLGRCGKTFCYEYNNIKPDLLCLGKALGGGIVPISVLVGKKEIMDLWRPGDDGSTFGGYGMASAIACESLDVLIEEKIAERAYELGKKFISWLKTIESPFIKEVRGKGLLVGIELWPDAGGARKFVDKLLLEEKLICKEAHHHIMRFSMPLIISQEQLEIAAEKIERVLKH